MATEMRQGLVKGRWCALSMTAAFALTGACREGDPSSMGNSIPIGVVPGESGANGCVAEAGVFVAPVTPAEVTLVGYDAGAAGQVTAAGEGEVLYLSGADGQIWAVDVSDPAAPLMTGLVSAGTVEYFLSVLGAPVVPVLGGLRVMDPDTLVVIETATHCLLVVDRFSPDTVGVFAGDPVQGAGYVDELASSASFDLDPRCQPFVSESVSPDGSVSPEVWIPDANNHALRRVSGGFVSTAVGGVGAGDLDGDVEVASLDSPHGLSATCAGTLLILEGGGRLRALESFGHPFFGWQGGEVSTLAVGLQGPVSPITSSDDEVYWVDSDSGVLRRYLDGVVDCPLAVDCAAAVASPAFTPGAVISLTRTPSGALFVLDASTGKLYFIDN